MRYFFGLFLFVALLVGLSTLSVPTYDLTIERSPVLSLSGGVYRTAFDSPKNVWYIGVPHDTLPSGDICVEWDFQTDTRKECFDHDGEMSDEAFTFPILSNPLGEASFRILGSQAQLNPRDITVYAMDTRAVGSRLELSLPGAQADTNIISRKEWGADETLRYKDHPKWIEFFKKREASKNIIKTPEQIAKEDREAQREKDRMAVLKNHLGDEGEIVSTVRIEDGHPLVWPIQKVKKISRIVLHHTDTTLDGRDDAELIRGIYAYHTLSRGWGDIGYNYIVGQRGHVYEGRAGGDYTIAAHASYNNMGTVGISVLGSYTASSLTSEQQAGLDSIVTMVAQKYGITLSDTKKGFRICDSGPCYPLKIITTQSLLGHRDVANTDCPGDNIYINIPDMISRLSIPQSPYALTRVDTPIKDAVLSTDISKETLFTNHNAIPNSTVTYPNTRYVGQKFKVKLSYPNTNNITLSIPGKNIGRLTIRDRKIPVYAKHIVQVGLVGNNQLHIQLGSKEYTSDVVSISGPVVQIDSWDHIPDWDAARKYNDNIYRDTIKILAQDNRLLVINELPVEWYLKGMGEVSNGDLPEKIKTIIVAARSYARHYMGPSNRKFSTPLYDGSDDPDEFQKYLGYGYEYRSPNVARLVDATRGQVITYSGQLIKPWYFSSSDGRTYSALEYCQMKTPQKQCEDIPYLQSVVDPGGIDKSRSGHGVGISGIGSTFFAKQGWDYKKIIQYYLQGVEIERK